MSVNLPDAPDFGMPHRHTLRCYWDFTECHWACPPSGSPTGPVAEAGSTPTSSASSAPATSPAPQSRQQAYQLS